jgi:lipopolysaccharide biosynthesis regulator YciM
MNGDEMRLALLKGMLSFQKGDYKKCVKTLEDVVGRLDDEFSEEASFYLAYSYLKRGDLAAGEKCAARIQNPDYVHQLMLLMEQIKAAPKGPRREGHQEKGKK